MKTKTSPNPQSSRGAAANVLRPPYSALRTRVLAPAFTLVELLIVLAIVTVVVALGIPLFGALTGAKSVEAGRNLVAATIGAARTIAVNEGKYCGILFAVDPATERTSMTVVIVNDPSSGLEDPDPYDKYKAVIPGERYYAGQVTGTDVRRADRVIGIAVDADATFKPQAYVGGTTNYINYFGNYRPVVRTYRATEDNVANYAAGESPPRNGPYGPNSRPPAPVPYPVPKAVTVLGGSTTPPTPASTVGPFANRYWDGQPESSLSRYSGEQQLLPKGVGVQVIVQQLALNTSGTSSSVADRYLGVAVVMFDPQGRLVNQSYAIDPRSQLGVAMGFASTSAGPQLPVIPAGLGIVLFDLGQFREQGFSIADYTFATNSNAGPRQFAFDAGTVIGQAMSGLMKSPPAYDQTAAAAGVLAGEELEEQWLDNNTVPLLINRFSGALSATD